MVKVVARHAIQRRNPVTKRLEEIQPKGVFDATPEEVTELLRVSDKHNPAIRMATEVDEAEARSLERQGIRLAVVPERLPRKRPDGTVEVPDPITGLLPSEVAARARQEAERQALADAQAKTEEEAREELQRAEDEAKAATGVDQRDDETDQAPAAPADADDLLGGAQ